MLVKIRSLGPTKHYTQVKNNQTLYCISFILLILASSFPSMAQKVKTDFDTNNDFTKYKTYAWLAPGDSVLNRHRSDKLYEGSILYAANGELKSRGLRMDTLNPQAVFVFNTTVGERTEYSQSPTLSVGVGVAGPGYYVESSAPVAGGKITSTTVEDGLLSYDMYDTKTGKLVWTAYLEKTFSLTDDVQQIVMDATKKIFTKYPVKKSNK